MTNAFGPRLAAIDPTALALVAPGAGVDRAGVEGDVVARTFRRDHFLLGVRLAHGEDVRVAVALGADAPEIGDRVHVVLRGDARVLPLDDPGTSPD